MDPDFWLERWQDNRIGFHEGVPNALLVAHFAAMGLQAPGTVFVPLCGKSHDLHWLRAQGFGVVGAELSRTAVQQFFAEIGLTPTVTPAGGVERFEAAGVRIFVGDIFALDRATLGPVDAIYDRAALVALPDPMRARYAAHLIELTDTAPQLLITFEYDETAHSGPPFSVPEAEMRKCYDATYKLARVEMRDVQGGLKGYCPATESLWLLTPR